MCAPWERDVLRFIDTDASSCTLTPPSDSLSQYGSDKVSGMSHIRPYCRPDGVFLKPHYYPGTVTSKNMGFSKNTLS